MRAASAEMISHLAEEVTSLAFCYRIERRDGEVLGFTSWDIDFEFESDSYTGNTVSAPTTIKSSITTGVDNLELGGAVRSDRLSDDDLRSGLYDDAKLEVFIVNALDLTMGKIVLFSGYVGEVSWNDAGFRAEARSLLQRGVQEVGHVCMPTCRAELGDTACGVNLAGTSNGGHANQVGGTVTGVTDRRQFADTSLAAFPTSHFAVGKLVWTSGANEGLTMEVKSSTTTSGEIALQLEMPNDIEVGDEFTITVGCDGRHVTCRDKFNNVARFRGEPHIPGSDATIRVTE